MADGRARAEVASADSTVVRRGGIATPTGHGANSVGRDASCRCGAERGDWVVSADLMSVIDFPRPQLHKIRMGTIVVVQLDPEASLASLSDNAVDQAASLMTPRRRLALLTHHSAPQDGFEARAPWFPPDLGRFAARRVGLCRPLSSCQSYGGALADEPPRRAPTGKRVRPYTVWVRRAYLATRQHGAVGRERVLRLGEGWENEPEDVLDARDFANPPPTPPQSLIEPHYRMWLNLGDGDHDDFADPSTLEGELAQLRVYDHICTARAWTDRQRRIEQEWLGRKTEEVQTKCDRFTHWREELAEQDNRFRSEPIPSPCDDDVSPDDAVDNIRLGRTEEDAESSGNQNVDV